MKMRKLAVVTTHPIQYHAPWFRASAACPDLDLEVFFCYQPNPAEQGKAGFGVTFEWDVPLLDGYKHRFLRNKALTPTLGSFSGLDTPEIGDIIARERFDSVIVNGWHYKSAWQAIRACWATRTPVMVRGDSHLHSPRHPVKALLKWLPYRWLIPKFDACLAAGRWSADYFEHYGAQRERIFFVPHVIDDIRFSSDCARLTTCRAELRRKWDLNQDDVVFLFAGKLIEQKRPKDFIRAIKLAAHRANHIKGLIVGDGPLRQECEELTAGENSAFRFAGFLNQSEIPTAYLASDALVLPSDSETWGLVVNEAMTVGRACIVSDRVGCGPDLITPDETGFVFPLGDVRALAELILKCQSNLPRLAHIGQCARGRVSRYSTSVAVGGVLQALSALGTTTGGAFA